jgi:hypothetical protein
MSSKDFGKEALLYVLALLLLKQISYFGAGPSPVRVARAGCQYMADV